MWFGSALGDIYYPEGRRLGRPGKLGAAAGSPPGTESGRALVSCLPNSPISFGGRLTVFELPK